MDYRINQYREWLEQNVTLTNPFSTQALKDVTAHLIMGRNYRLLTEPNTKGKLFSTFLWLNEIKQNASTHYGENWIEDLFTALHAQRRLTPEQRNLLVWMMGLTSKTAVNLGFRKQDYPTVFQETVAFFDQLLARIGRRDFKDTAWLLLMAGSATLNIRGSQKSKIGKQLEKVFLRATLTLLGFVENESYWMNIDRDNEVDRESDAEVLSRRGRIRIEVGLIAPGNQEVIEDKIARVGRNGVIIFDKLGANTRVHQTATRAEVRLIQVRNSSPLVDLYRHLNPLVSIPIVEPPTTEEEIRRRINGLPATIFQINEADAEEDDDTEETEN